MFFGFCSILQTINALKAENNVINTKLRRVEGENVLKVCYDKRFFHGCVKIWQLCFCHVVRRVNGCKCPYSLKNIPQTILQRRGVWEKMLICFGRLRVPQRLKDPRSEPVFCCACFATLFQAYLMTDFLLPRNSTTIMVSCF